MRPRYRVLAISLATALTLVTVGCGDDNKGGGNAAVTDENRPYVEAMSTSMKDSREDEEDMQLTDAQIDCIAPRFVNIIGVDRMKENGVTPEDLASDDPLDFSTLKMDEKEGNTLYDTFGQCDVNLREVMMTSFAQDDDMSPEMRKCMEDVFTDDNLRTLMVSSMVKGDDAMENDPAVAPMMGRLMGCAFMGMGEEMGDTDFDMDADDMGMDFDDMDIDDLEFDFED